jgi:ribonuclease P protein component
LSSNLTPAKARQTLPKQNRLSARAEFQKIYALGQRYDGRLMAAFLRKNDLPGHRLGVTASTKAIGKSVDRNRARRLLREVFRRSRNELDALGLLTPKGLCSVRTKNFAFVSFVELLSKWRGTSAASFWSAPAERSGDGALDF